MSSFHHDLGCQSASSVKKLVVSRYAFKPHFSCDRVGRIVSPYILDEVQNLVAITQRAAMHRSGGTVDLVITVDRL